MEEGISAVGPGPGESSFPDLPRAWLSSLSETPVGDPFILGPFPSLSAQNLPVQWAGGQKLLLTPDQSSFHKFSSLPADRVNPLPLDQVPAE